MTTMRPVNRRAFSKCFLVVALCAFSGCVPSEQNAWVFVDNTSGNEIVTVDSVEVVKVPARSVEKIKVITGEHRFMVQSGGTIVYNAAHTITPSSSFLSMQRYILNPDRRARYATCNVHYGQSWSEKIKLVSLSQPGNEEAFIRSEYSSLAKDLKPLPTDSWLEVPPGAIVFEPAPERVVAKRTATRLVLSRITDEDHRYLRSAINLTNPTEDDLDSLRNFAGMNFF